MSLGAPGKRCGPGVELGVGDGAGERGHVAVPIMRERAAEERIEHVLDRDAAGEPGDAVLGPFKVADVEVMVERGVEPLRLGRADEHARHVSLGEDGGDRGQVGLHTRVGDEDGHVALGRSERRPYLPFQIVVARSEEAAGERVTGRKTSARDRGYASACRC